MIDAILVLLYCHLDNRLKVVLDDVNDSVMISQRLITMVPEIYDNNLEKNNRVGGYSGELMVVSVPGRWDLLPGLGESCKIHSDDKVGWGQMS